MDPNNVNSYFIYQGSTWDSPYTALTSTAVTPAGTEVVVTLPTPEPAPDPELAKTLISRLRRPQGLAPGIAFRFMKSKLNKTQQAKLKAELDRLKKLVVKAHEQGNERLFEEFSGMIGQVVREQEADACGCGRWLNQQFISQLKDKVRDRQIVSCTLDKFPRLIPDRAMRKIKSIQSKQIFDKYYVLYTDYSGEPKSKELKKTNAEKIREKDPICFGVFIHNPGRWYVITDWVDEYCDLTVVELVNQIKLDHPDFALNDATAIDQELVDAMKTETKRRTARLDETNRKTWEEKEKEAEEASKKLHAKIDELTSMNTDLKLELQEMDTTYQKLTDTKPLTWWQKLRHKGR